MKLFNEKVQKKKLQQKKVLQMEAQKRLSSPIRGARSNSPFYRSMVYKESPTQNQRSASKFYSPIRMERSMIENDTSQFNKLTCFENSGSDLSVKAQNVKNMLLRILDIASYPKDKPLLSAQQVDQVKLRIIGSFDSLNQINHQFS